MSLTQQSSKRRVVIKLSGEALANSSQTGLCDQQLIFMSQQIVRAAQAGIQIGIVVGGGNFMRGSASLSKIIERNTADQIGMLATLMNALALGDALSSLGQKIELFSAVELSGVCPKFNSKKVISALESGAVVVFGGGTGNPFCTTDSAAALRAVEIQADCVIKATKVDGIYNKDPKKYSDAVLYKTLSFDEVLDQKLEVMDLAAFTLCKEFKLPISVINLYQPNSIYQALMGSSTGSSIGSSGTLVS